MIDGRLIKIYHGLNEAGTIYTDPAGSAGKVGPGCHYCNGLWEAAVCLRKAGSQEQVCYWADGQ